MRYEARRDIAAWTHAGAIDRARVREALLRTGAIASPAAWRRFIAKALLWLAALALAAALGFFIAANWAALGRLGKLVLVQGVIVLALVIVGWRGLERRSGRVAIAVAALAVGTLLALLGQTYQTGADDYELFLGWALAIAPWALVARLPALWLLVIVLVDVVAWRYAAAAASPWSVWLGAAGVAWAILAVHALALVLWEIGLGAGLRWLDARYAVRALAGGAGIAATALVLESFFDADGGRRWFALATHAASIAALYFAYRVRRVDLAILSGAALSVIIVATVVLVQVEALRSIGGLLVIGLAVVALAALAARWLRGVAREASR